jgi:4-cresol dehydrogenase (hydroxylating)
MTVSPTRPRHAPAHPDPAKLLDLAAALIGDDRVLRYPADPAEADRPPRDPNVSMFRTRSVPAVLRPGTPEEVQQLVRLFADSPDPAALHAVSTGRNWGLGSTEPVVDGTVLLDLRRLSRIRALGPDAEWAVVEPGVTQAQLSAALAGRDRMLNVTASSAHTSVLGNALDRGVGLRRQRVADLAGLEVVLPDGESVRIGWWPDERGTAVYPYGLGPSPLQLFAQSDLGVATAGVIRLPPRPEAIRVLRFSFAEADLTAAVDELRRWVGQQLVHGVVKIYDTAANRIYGGNTREFSVHVCVDGTAEAADALSGIVAAEARRSGVLHPLDVSEAPESSEDSEGPADVVAAVVEHAYAGDPGHNDRLLRATLGQPASGVDAHGLGWLFFLPLVPFSGASVARAHALLDQVHAETGVRCGATVNALDVDVIDFVVSIKFERDEAQAAQAHRALDRLYELFGEAGFVPYRLDVEHAGWTDRTGAASRELSRRIKSLMDPRGVFAAGRYS